MPTTEQRLKTKKPVEMTPERAAEIINDIHEGLCRASRKELMECASHFSLRCCELYQGVQHAYSSVALYAMKEEIKFRDENRKR